ncbi:hypothetical protein PQQ52_04225 [Paraburkholderia sediminicola]|uniref:hypothetical protein n=1 Tax=Paraburkholderia sediminicola TaxID=458836 RepID=UPI0038BAC3B6
MKNILGINLIVLKSAPVFAKIAIVIYWFAALQYLYATMGGIFPHKIIREPVSTPAIPVAAIIGIGLILYAFGALKLFLAFKLSARKNWARIAVVIVSTLLAVFLIQGVIITVIIGPLPFFALLKGTYGLFAEVVAALLLLLPKSRGWFVPKRVSA